MKDLFGVIATFRTPEAVKDAAVRLRQSGFHAFEAYTPYAVEGLDRVIHPGPKRSLPLTMFAAAIVGAAGGYWIQYWDEALNYPLNVGGRPHNSWPAFMVSSFELMLLVTIAVGFVAMLAASRLPKLYHPIFEGKSFERASRDRFVICIEATDPGFDRDLVRDIFEDLGAERIEEVRA